MNDEIASDFPPITPESPKRAKKMTYLLVVLVPLFVYTVVFYKFYLRLTQDIGTDHLVSGRALSAYLGILAICALLLTLSQVLYIVNVYRNPLVAKERRIMWALLFVFFFDLAFIYYWTNFIWREESQPKRSFWPIVLTALLAATTSIIVGYAYVNLVNKQSSLIKSRADQLRQVNSYNGRVAAAKTAWSLGDYTQTVDAANQALAVSANDQERAEAYYWRGIGNLDLNKLTEAKSDETTSIKLNSSFGPPHVTLGAAYVAEGDLVRARQEANIAIKLDPSYAWGYNLLGLVEFRSGNRVLAVADEQKAIQLDSSQASFVQNLHVFEGLR